MYGQNRPIYRHEVERSLPIPAWHVSREIIESVWKQARARADSGDFFGMCMAIMTIGRFMAGYDLDTTQGTAMTISNDLDKRIRAGVGLGRFGRV